MFASGISRIHRCVPLRPPLAPLTSLRLLPPGTPHDATELTETAAARLRELRSRIPPFGLLPQCTCGAQLAGTYDWFFLADEISAETVKLSADMFVGRWLGKKGGARGSGAKIGIRNPLHCLAWKLDIYARCTIQYCSSNGPEILRAIDASFPSDAIEEALKTYSQGNGPLESKLLSF